jgi:hypothetical protein
VSGRPYQAGQYAFGRSSNELIVNELIRIRAKTAVAGRVVATLAVRDDVVSRTKDVWQMSGHVERVPSATGNGIEHDKRRAMVSSYTHRAVDVTLTHSDCPGPVENGVEQAPRAVVRNRQIGREGNLEDVSQVLVTELDVGQLPVTHLLVVEWLPVLRFRRGLPSDARLVHEAAALTEPKACARRARVDLGDSALPARSNLQHAGTNTQWFKLGVGAFVLVEVRPHAARSRRPALTWLLLATTP